MSKSLISGGMLSMFLTAWSFLSAQVPMEVSPPAAEYPSLLWEISGNGLETPSYLYGTIHIIPQDSFYVSDKVEELLESSERLVMEMELDAATMMSSAMGMMLKPPNSLKSLLSDEDYTFLRGFMRDSLRQPLPMYQMIKPIFIEQHVSMGYCMDEQPASYELYFMQKYNEWKKPISGLETAEEQLKFFDSITLEEQAQSLMETIREPGKLCEQYSQMVSLYRQQNLDSLISLTQEDPDIGEHTDVLLDNRNQNWISQLEAFMQEEQVFIAVGAAHLPGEQGVIMLLRAEGYEVTPVDNK